MVGLILCISSSTRMLFEILLTWDVLVSQNHRLPAHSSSSSSAVCAAAPPSADMRIHGYNIGKFVALPFHSIVEIIPSENHVAFAIMFHQTMRGDESWKPEWMCWMAGGSMTVEDFGGCRIG